jgi:hypothetical protein
MKVQYQLVLVAAHVALRLGPPTTDRVQAEYTADVVSRVVGHKIVVVNDSEEVVYSSCLDVQPDPVLDLVTGPL